MEKSAMKRAALKHYNRMIKWAGKQPANEKVCTTKMQTLLHERYFGDDCVYCQEDLKQQKKQNYPVCSECALCKNDECCDRLWSKMVYSKTWKTWIKNAQLVREYIKKNG